MDGPEPELYLRLLGERTLLGAERRDSWGSPLLRAARALVAVKAIDADSAAAVLDDYGLAASLRSGDRGHYVPQFGRRAEPAADPAALAARRVVFCNELIDLGGDRLHVRSVVLADDATAVAISYLIEPTLAGRRRGATLLMGGPTFIGRSGRPIALSDDRGTTAATDFHGEGDEERWRGRLHADRPLARDTAWIELDGIRIALRDAPPAGTVAVEPLPEEPPALRHLWSLLATSGGLDGPPLDLEPAIEALTAMQALDPEDPVLADIRAVATALNPYYGHPPGARQAHRGLPEPWKNLLTRRGRADGPTGTIPIGLASPVFDGFAVSAIALESNEDRFEVEVEVTPDLIVGHFDEEAGLDEQLVWWARDDRGNAYLGGTRSWRAGEDGGWGDIDFTPALDPRAKRLELRPTGPTCRAVIAFPLAWDPSR